ncbi:hypothetical protein IWW36_000753 [Coemansia brasiliensis]|uniref:Uncharacterized protein n=1 Tax=Coemansia brasiliensis TaxID=2650707 RepID=A0A9W8M0Y9_9FUNG|nr:hypothetical protein IWW36_000753 [Coemansia brasiliensis]
MSETIKTVPVDITVYGFDIPIREDINEDMTLGSLTMYLSNLVPDSDSRVRYNGRLIEETDETTLYELAYDDAPEIILTLVPAKLQVQVRNMTGQALKHSTYSGSIAYDATIQDLINNIMEELELDESEKYSINCEQQSLAGDLPIWKTDLLEYDTVIECE